MKSFNEQSTISVLSSCQYPSGLFAASKQDGDTGYHLAWIRDTIYATFGLEATGNNAGVAKAMHALLDVFAKHAYKIAWMIREPVPKYSFRYVHARYYPLSGNEVSGEWGNKQHDAVGLFLWRVGTLLSKGIQILRNEDDRVIIQLLVDYLSAIEYWQDPDNGMWEETEELHASSIGACIAGLLAVSPFVQVDPLLISRGKKALDELLPYETCSRRIDSALLSLIYPFNIVTAEQRNAILDAVESTLIRERGMIRYAGDKYYSTLAGEAEWPLGLAWFAVIYKTLGNHTKKDLYIQKAKNCMTNEHELPELFFAETNEHNENTPLAWAQSLWLVANEGMGKRT